MPAEIRKVTKENMEDFPFDPSLKIPPLLDPLPRLPSRRPSPLEPNACVNEGSHTSTAKLSTRSKALDEAKPIGDDDTASVYSAMSRTPASLPSKPDSALEGSRKRQKVNSGFFQLPKPNAKAKVDNVPPFKPVPILNELHEPPPSAALFPPITPNARNSRGEPSNTASKLTSLDQCRTRAHSLSSRNLEASDHPKETKTRVKRVYLRGRLKWTESETQDLMKGISIYGVGKWKKILTHPDLKFHPDRTMVDLKDRYRTCRMNEEKAIERQAASDMIRTKNTSTPDRANNNHEITEVVNEENELSRIDSRDLEKGGNKQLFSQGSEFDVCTPRNFKKQSASAKGRKIGASQPWTAEEDVDLSKGYHKYGFQWTAIAKDKDLCLGHRTGAQVRDRFRMKYPIVYQSSVPLPLPDVSKRLSRTGSDKQDLATALDKEFPNKSSSAELKFIINESIKPTSQVPKASSPKPSPYSGKRADTSATEPGSPNTPSIADRFSGLEVQPLPEPYAIGYERGSVGSDESSSDEMSRQSTAEAEEARHLSILGLLNEEAEQNSRLPSFKYPFEDAWVTEENVTLPPLHWEEIASRPMFDLE